MEDFGITSDDGISSPSPRSPTTLASPGTRPRRRSKRGFLFTLMVTGPGVLEFSEEDPNQPLRLGEIEVRMEYSSVQPQDTEMLQEREDRPFPYEIGFDGVGTVITSRNDDFPVGDRVAFAYRDRTKDYGCWRAKVVVDNTRACICTVPLNLVPQEAAAVITSALTALACLRHFAGTRHAPGAVVVVTGACGAVGLSMIQEATRMGMRVVALVRGGYRCGWLEKELGGICQNRVSAVDVTAPRWEQLAASLCANDGADGVVDCVGGDLLEPIARHLLRKKGKIVRYGAVAGEPEPEGLASAVRAAELQLIHENIGSVLQASDASQHLLSVLKRVAARESKAIIWQSANWRDAAECLVAQPPWSKYPTLFDMERPWEERRCGRIILKFD
eukprot:TRINITY_DN16295_c0_g3_i1.p1 TRINITY_DN16295_c0_g3~~TRINITY_DN16295_c0_g3_i1.p1  ORF type:complete len:418 (+),score=88.39 TRINITY_DN16295_c0_g3_i1:93-1256(+)